MADKKWFDQMEAMGYHRECNYTPPPAEVQREIDILDAMGVVAGEKYVDKNGVERIVTMLSYPYLCKSKHTVYAGKRAPDEKTGQMFDTRMYKTPDMTGRATCYIAFITFNKKKKRVIGEMKPSEWAALYNWTQGSEKLEGEELPEAPAEIPPQFAPQVVIEQAKAEKARNEGRNESASTKKH
jgi:hypothetical protein